MLHNPEEYPQPDVFNPDRFIKDGSLNPDVRDPTTLAFGFGRRCDVLPHLRLIASTEPYISACPGRALAQTSAFLAIATVLHVFNIKAVTQSDKKPFDPFEATSGIIV